MILEPQSLVESLQGEHEEQIEGAGMTQFEVVPKWAWSTIVGLTSLSMLLAAGFLTWVATSIVSQGNSINRMDVTLKAFVASIEKVPIDEMIKVRVEMDLLLREFEQIHKLERRVDLLETNTRKPG